MGRADRFSHALVRMNAAEEKQILAAISIERKISVGTPWWIVAA
jgi:hypothetical protein